MSPGGEPIEVAVPGYPTLLWVARHGALLPFVAALPVLGSAFLFAFERHSAGWAVLGVMGGGAAFLLARLLVEIVRLLVETLIPQ